MSKSNTFENDILGLIFTATAIANIADNASVSPLTNLWISLHTSTGPGEAGDQTTNEATYTSYARVSVARSGSGWTVAGNQCTNDAEIAFPECTGGSDTVTYFAIGTAETSTGKVLFYGELTSSLAVSTGITPRFAASAMTISED